MKTKTCLKNRRNMAQDKEKINAIIFIFTNEHAQTRKKWKNNKDNNKNNQCIGALCIGSFASHARDLGFVLSVSICDYRRSDIGLLDTYILYIFIYIHIYIYIAG